VNLPGGLAQPVQPFLARALWERGRLALSKAIGLAVLAICLAALVSPTYAAGQPARVGQEEIEMGRQAAAEAEKDHPLLHDSDLNARVQRIGAAIAAVANSVQIDAAYGSSTLVPFSYTFSVVDDSGINAFSLPGGYVYIFKGLIEFCESDHELAAVIAHEVAHAAHHHMVYLLRRQSRLEGQAALILAASLLADVRARDLSNIMLGAQFYKMARVSGYGQKAERDADLTAVDYMTRASYNPVGMLTFLERLADRPDPVDWGILQTHPRAGDRAALVKERLVELGVEIDRRSVTISSTAVVRPLDPAGTSAYEVAVGPVVVCRVRQEDRARSIAERINTLLDSNLQIRELKLSGAAVLARGSSVIEVTDDDASVSGEPPAQVARQAGDALRRVLFRQIVAQLW